MFSGAHKSASARPAGQRENASYTVIFEVLTAVEIFKIKFFRSIIKSIIAFCDIRELKPKFSWLNPLRKVKVRSTPEPRPPHSQKNNSRGLGR